MTHIGRSEMAAHFFVSETGLKKIFHDPLEPGLEAGGQAMLDPIII